MVLLGWEVKSLRAGKCNLAEAYVMLKDGEAWLFGCRIEPLQTASTHVVADPLRNRKLLLHRRQLSQLFAGVQRDGYTCVPVSLYWDRGRAKLKSRWPKANRSSTSGPPRRSVTGAARNSD